MKLNEQQRKQMAEKVSNRKIGDTLKIKKRSHFLSSVPLKIEKIDLGFYKKSEEYSESDFNISNIVYHCVAVFDGKTYRMCVNESDV